MRKIVVVLKSGGDFTAEDVLVLFRQIKRSFFLPDIKLYCLTDVPFQIPGVERIPLKYNYPGKWSMHEVFRITGQVVCVGLDTIFVRNCDVLFEETKKLQPDEFAMINSFHPARQYANGIMSWNGDWTRLLKYKVTPNIVRRYKMEQKVTIQNLKEEKAKIKSINNWLPIYSYKHHIQGKGIPQDCKLILFHGKPRPKDVNETEIKKLRLCETQF
jgi:hypothetical protein